MGIIITKYYLLSSKSSVVVSIDIIIYSITISMVVQVCRKNNLIEIVEKGNILFIIFNLTSKLL